MIDMKAPAEDLRKTEDEIEKMRDSILIEKMVKYFLIRID